MNFKFLRGACVLIQSTNTQVLCDPWLTDGEYYGAWAHYPPYAWEDDLSSIDYIYVSHIHPDHYSIETMKRLPKVPVLIHKFITPFLKRSIESLGFEVRELPHNIPVQLDDMRINIIAADDCDPDVCQRFFGCSSPAVENTQIDSMAVFEDDYGVIVNVNDCPYHLSKTMLPKIRLQYPEIDVLMVAYAGAGPYPQCFEMPLEKKIVAANLKKNSFIAHAAMFAKDLQPKKVFPFAGDYVLCGKLTQLNKYRGVAELWEVYDQLARADIPYIETDQPSSALKNQYIYDYLANKKLDYEYDEEPTEIELIDMIAEAFGRLEYKRKELGFSSDTAVYIPLMGNSVKISLNGNGIIPDSKTTSAPFIKMTVDPRLLKRILSGPRYAHWNNAEIGSHIMFDRKPDNFERGIHHLVSFLHV